MPSPFPGMDPYLEHPQVWPGFHDKLIVHTVAVLQPSLRDRGYYIDSNQRVWMHEPERGIYPDNVVLERIPSSGQSAAASSMVADEPIVFDASPVEVRESYAEIFDRETHEVVTGIEFVSPSNKVNKKGRKLYRRKQRETRKQGVHLVEIDLIRQGPSVVDVPEPFLESVAPCEYVATLGRRRSSRVELYPIRLRDRLPRIRIPLKDGDEDAVLDLREVFDRSYEIGPYPDRLDYSQQPFTPLSAEDAAWADELLKQAGFRQ